ncbi:MAG: SDR family NAD(P)-dependent oxidoreductase [Lysobacter sp.]|nr:MAG: SDR family NAD(P)-dependent oxidoreductase [Lysobacter sp.]
MRRDTMHDQERLQDQTESYLKAMIAGASNGLAADFDASLPFGELGVDSFRVLKIIKDLEADFGTLPKTLLFENFNVESLARYFVRKHSATLTAKFGSPSVDEAAEAPKTVARVSASSSASAPAHAQTAAPKRSPSSAVATSAPARAEKSSPLVPPMRTVTQPPASSASVASPLRLLEADLPHYPELRSQLEALYARYSNEGCVSRGTRIIAPNLFVGGARRGYFNYGRSGDAMLIYAYTGPADYFDELAAETLAHCRAHGLRLNLFTDVEIGAVAGCAFSATAFGALQRVHALREFSLEGGAMRRLRYQVGKFEKAGACRTVEYARGADARTDRDIVDVIDRWCETKPMVNPLIGIVREEILAGSLHPQHRVFLTYLDDVLQNVILISKMGPELNGYLMDLEFYPREMPLGGLEYAIVRIIETLAAEGCDMLSLGGTYGVRLTGSSNPDPNVDRVLDDLHRQGIFNDEGNLQFKNKFRPENRTIYLCRPVEDASADNVVDLIMMIADPNRQTPDIEHHNAAAVLASVGAPASTPGPIMAQVVPLGASTPEERAREASLAEAGYDPLALADEDVEYDLKTDSWAQLRTPYVAQRMQRLRTQLQQPADLTDSLRAIFPFRHFAIAESGRAADHLFCRAWPKKGLVPQNLLFPSCLYHQIDKGFEPLELPHPSLFASQTEPDDRGEPDWERLRALVAERAGEIAYVCIEVCDNAAGGHPVSLARLRGLREFLRAHDVALVVDATRILENARALIQRDPECAGRSLWDVARDVLAQADAAIGSLAKDFCVDRGGIVATNDERLARELSRLQQQDGSGLDAIDRKLLALALQDRGRIESQVVRRMEAASALWRALKNAGLPVYGPPGAHCVLIEVGRIAALQGLSNPVASFLAWLYRSTGIRAGAHSVGMQRGTTINDLVRIAVPVGLKPEAIDEIAARMARMLAAPRDIPDLVRAMVEAESEGETRLRYALQGWRSPSAHRDAGATTALIDLAASPSESAPSESEPPTAYAGDTMPSVSQNAHAAHAGGGFAADAPIEIAIVGMAGRYPKAADLREFWRNLRDGRDCVGPLPEERMAQRARNEYTMDYRGGFIDAVDRFDSLFFNISPREAEILDPQERLFLEVAWEALEDAGYYPENLAPEGAPRQVGVFVGAVWAMYQILGVEEKLAGRNVSPNSFLWSVANRVSFWMNLTGPSLTVDTACSSSLTALYLACEAIRRGDCSSAIVGGVNLDLHQTKFDINWAGGALSPDGVCRSFGADANGYVAGEGVGAIFVKPLSQAIADHDHVYAVIRSATSNHGGRTSGYTVPNPKAQGELVSAALARAGVDARSIGYIEAHGTGTELGDPVEISGLCAAFEHSNVPNGHCAIGSVKTNIGHLEAAAGLVGVCKAALQMRHRELVPSLHSARSNPHIDFESTPFRVQQRLEPWRAFETNGVRMPLRAGISSFGAGGANAHVVIEEASLPASAEALPRGGTVFPLSARNDDQLRDVAKRLRRHLEGEGAQQSLCDIAFTLQSGRKSFDCRVAIVADGRHDLIEKLSCFIEGRRHDDVLTGNVRNADGITRLLSRAEKEQFVALLSQSREPHKLAQLWLDGLLSDCRGMLRVPARRASLPTYPFADKRHWIGSPRVGASSSTPALRAGMHPLIDSNESTFQRQLFRKRFRAQEFFLRDHVVSNVPTLPGTAYLEMARVAGEAAAGRKVRKLRNITWISPLTAEDAAPTDAIIELKPAADAVAFEVFADGQDGRRRVFAQGKLIYDAPDAAAPPAEYIDLAAIRARCAKVVDGRDAYPLFKSVGMAYGPSFQVLQEVFKNQDEVLGLLRLPDARNADFDAFVLHPCLMDASMQAGVVGQLGDAAGEMKVPYSIGEVEFLHPLTKVCYSHITPMKSERAASGVSRENVAIVDESGRVLARIRESVGVPLTQVHEKPTQPTSVAPTQAEEFVDLRYSHVWRSAPAVASGVSRMLLLDSREDLAAALRARGVAVTLARPGDAFEDLGERGFRLDPSSSEDFAKLFEALAASGRMPDAIAYAWNDAVAIDEPEALQAALERGVYGLLRLSQALLDRKPSERVRLAYVYAGEPGAYAPQHDAINGFVRSLRLEHPKIDAKAVELRGQSADASAAALIAELGPDAQDEITVRYERGERMVRTLQRLDATALPSDAPGVSLKHEGVYLITGGAGGLGLIFADHLAREYKAKLVLTGRSALSADREARLDAMRAHGAEVLYVAADASTAEGVADVLAQARARFGRINGIVHAAGVLRDSYLRKKTASDLHDVFAPKIFGTLHLDAQTRDDDLDFFVLFSSLAAIGGNAGQCDYAFANHFMDSFAEAREAQRAAGTRRGRTLSLNWSLWAEGGMRLDEQTEQFFRKNLGIKPLETDVGLTALVSGLASDRAHLAVLQGQPAKIESAWGLVKKAPAPTTSAPGTVATAPAPAAAGGDLETAVIGVLSDLVMEMLKLGQDELSIDNILLDLGFDSIGLAGFANAINDRYGLDINPVMFFEYPSIRAIAGVLATEHGAAVRNAHSGVEAGVGAVAVAAAQASPATAPVASSAKPIEIATGIDKGWNAMAAVAPATTASSIGPGGDFSRDRRFLDVPIAIVGVAGVMPQSSDIEEFWENLRDARNLVTDIPRDRWIWEEFHGNPVKEANKSYSKWGGFMKEVDKFDPLFFGITPREAEMMDPQQRIFIETVWSAVEDAGHRMSDLSGTKTGVFVGVSAKDYIDVLAENQSTLDGFSASGNSHSILANRISFLFNLRGPSAPLDTACSSSLVALHRAIESIHTGSSDMAIVGGVQVMLTPIAHISLSSAGMLSPDGKCKTFDKDANGYVRGEGVGAILIKPLAQAEADGNPVYAVIRATAENHGGRVTMLTAPNPKAQAELLFEAYEKGGVDPSTVGYIECHGTGTSLGDPIEIQALKKSFSDLYRRHGLPAPSRPHCGLSSVKTNIGHLEPAAGMASLLKVLMSIRHRQIPALLHFETLNPYIDLEGSPFFIVDKTVEWPAPKAADGRELPRRAGISSFGWGGANAHVVVEEYRPPARPHPETAPRLVLLSAKNEDRLNAYAAALLEYARKHEALELADLAFTLQVGRDPMEERLGILVDSREALISAIEAHLSGASATHPIRRGRVQRYKRNDQGLSVAEGGADARGADIERWLSARDYLELLAAWTDGADIDWRRLYDADASGFRPRRIHLPTYPFARDRHWIDTGTAKKAQAATAVLHPLVHTNTSTLGRQTFATRFAGSELWLLDHAGTLPDSACLEMGRAAAALARFGADARSGAELRAVRWNASASAIGSGHAIAISVREGGTATEFDIRAADGESICSGSVVFADIAPPSRLDLRQMKAVFGAKPLKPSLLDAALDGLRPARGPSLRLVDEVYSTEDQSLARLRASPTDEAACALPPARLDAALQIASALVAGFAPDSAQITTPSALDALQIFAPVPHNAYAWVRYARGGRIDDPVVRLDIDLIDEEGAVCVRFKGLGLRANRPRTALAADAATEFARLLESAYAAVPASAGTTTAAPHDATTRESAPDDAFEKLLENIL